MIQKIKLLEEQTAKKIGEVLAFEEVGVDTIEKGETALKEKFGEYSYAKVLESYRKNLDDIRNTSNSQIDILSKAETTMEKLEQMRELYLGGEWDDATEILEWLGFFEGAAKVHWSLINSIAKEKKYKELHKISTKIMNFHSKFLDAISYSI